MKKIEVADEQKIAARRNADLQSTRLAAIGQVALIEGQLAEARKTVGATEGAILEAQNQMERLARTAAEPDPVEEKEQGVDPVLLTFPPLEAVPQGGGWYLHPVTGHKFHGKRAAIDAGLLLPE